MRIHLKSSHSIDLTDSQPGPSSDSTSTRSTQQQEPKSVDTIQEQQKPSSSDDSNKTSKKRKISEYFLSSQSMEATICRMVARDGIPFGKFWTSIDLRRILKKAGYDHLPSAPKSIKNICYELQQTREKKINRRVKGKAKIWK